MINKYSFGRVDQFIIFGGGQYLFDAVVHLMSLDIKVLVVTSTRHHNSPVKSEGQAITLNDALSLMGIQCKLVGNLDSESNWKRIVTSETVGVSISAEWIFRRSIIELFHGRLVNLHGSRLPEMGGCGGLSWNMLMGNKRGGSTIHFIDEGIDTGDILMQDVYDYPLESKTLDEFLVLSSKRNRDLLIRFLNKILANETFLRCKQDQSDATYWPRLKTDIHGFINWSWCANDINSFIAAFGPPYLGASTFIMEKFVRILRADVTPQSCRYHPFQYGIIFHISELGLHVAVKDGELVVESVTDDSNKAIPISLGSRFYTPSVYLETAKRTRVIFKA